MDGFELNDTATKWDEALGSSYGVLAGGRNGQGIYVVNGGANRVRKQVDAADEHATMTAGRAFRNHGGTNDSSAWVGGSANWGNLFCFLSDSGVTPHISIVAQSANVIAVFRGLMNGTLLGSYTMPTITYTEWYYIEAKVVLSDTVGSVEVKVNGATVILLTNIDTKNGGTKTVLDSIGIGAPQTLNNVHNGIDDFYLCNGAGAVNNTFLGDVVVETIYPSGDGSSSQFLGSDGNSVSNYLLVDEPGTPLTTDYVEDGVSGHKDLYAIGNLVRTAGPILGVQVTDHVVNTDAGAVSAKVSLKSGATSAASAAVPLTTTYKTARKMWELNPDGSVAWDIAAVNAIEAGVEVA